MLSAHSHASQMNHHPKNVSYLLIIHIREERTLAHPHSHLSFATLKQV